MIATATDVADAIFEQLKALKEMRTRAAKELGISFDLPEEMTVQGAIVTAAGINAVTRTDTVDQVGKDTTTETALKSTVLETRNTEDRKQNDGDPGKEFRTTTEES